MTYALFRTPLQLYAEDIGWGVHRYLTAVEILGRCLSCEDGVVREWLRNPATYPREFQEEGMLICLWGSVIDNEIDCLFHRDGRVGVRKKSLAEYFSEKHPALVWQLVS